MNVVKSLLNVIYIIIMSLPVFVDKIVLPEPIVNENDETVFETVSHLVRKSAFENAGETPIVVVIYLIISFVSIVSSLMLMKYKDNSVLKIISNISLVLSTIGFICLMILAAVNAKRY